MSKLDKLSGEQIRHLRRDWMDVVDDGDTTLNFQQYIETVTQFTDGTPIITDTQGIIVIEPVDRDRVNRSGVFVEAR